MRASTLTIASCLLALTVFAGAAPPAKRVKSRLPRGACSPAGRSRPGCEFVRLDCPGGAMEKVSVPNQLDLGICYSVAAAEVAQAYVDTYGDRNGDRTHSFAISPVHSAYGTFSHEPEKEREKSLKKVEKATKLGRFRIPIEGGYSHEVLEYLLARGACPRSILDELEALNPKRYAHLYEALLDGIETYKQVFKIEDSARLIAAEKKKLVAWTENCLTKNGVDIEPDAFRDLALELFQGETLAEIHDAIRCPHERREYFATDAAVKHDWLLDRSPAAVEQRLHDHFKSGKSQPLIIRYCSKLLEKGPGYVGVNRDVKAPEDDDAFYRKGCDGHASVLIGRAFDPVTKSCRFLVQNSWGATCDLPYASRWKCEEETGKIWLDAGELANNVYGTAHLEKGAAK